MDQLPDFAESCMESAVFQAEDISQSGIGAHNASWQAAYLEKLEQELDQ